MSKLSVFMDDLVATLKEKIAPAAIAALLSGTSVTKAIQGVIRAVLKEKVAGVIATLPGPEVYGERIQGDPKVKEALKAVGLVPASPEAIALTKALAGGVMRAEENDLRNLVKEAKG